MSCDASSTPDEVTDRANGDVFERLMGGTPVWCDVRPAREVVPGMTERMVLHAGPPLPTGHRVTGALRGTAIGAALYERWAETPDDAARLLDTGQLHLEPASEHGALGTYCGGISPSAPVMLVEDLRTGTRAYNNFNEGRGKALRYGAYDGDVLTRLRWFERVLAPVLREAVRGAGGVPVFPLIAQALHMGDECHSRHKAASALLANHLGPHIVGCDFPSSHLTDVLRFLAGSEIFFLNLTMAAAKSVLRSVEGTPGSSLVTAMARNGVEFGIRIAAFADRWFTAPVPPVVGRYFEGYGPGDATPDIGDSAVSETLGLGAFSLAAAPALARYMGLAPSQTRDVTMEMYQIVHGEHRDFTIPGLDYRGVPSGIDIRKVVGGGVTPVTNTGIAHRDGVSGQIGAGYVRTPLACYERALAALRASLASPRLSH